MAREFLKGVKSENRLSKVRLIMPNDPVIGGQPSDNAEEFTSNTPFLDLACSIQYAVTQAANANTAAKNADTKAVAAQKTADEAKTAAVTADSKAVAADKKAGTAQTTANQAKTAAATADGKAVAAQKTADEAKTAAATADSKAVEADKKAGTAQTTANQAKTAAATADGKAVAAQKTADEAKTVATGAKTAADNAQKKANQVPNPLLDQLPIGASSTAYKLITLADLKEKLSVPAKTNVVQTTGTSTTAVMSQKAVTDLMGGLLKAPRNVKNERVLETTYTNTTNGVLIVTVSCAHSGGVDRSPVNVKIDGVEIIPGLGARNQTFQYVITAFVPPMSKYSVHCTGANFSSWVEQSI